MIDRVVKVLAAYNKLDAQGKRLVRDELGLVRPQQATKRRRRVKVSDLPETAPKQTRTRRAVVDPAATVTEGVPAA